MRTPPEDTVAELVEVLDEVDWEWRAYVEVWDRVRGGMANAVRG